MGKSNHIKPSKKSYASSKSRSDCSISCSSSSSSLNDYCPSEPKYKEKCPKEHKCKDLACKARIGVDLDVIPEVKCTKGCTQKGEFKVAVNAKSNITCHLEPVKTVNISDCEGECQFLITLHNKVNFEPRILSKCEVPTVYADLDIKARTRQRC